jgi:hypothetical protein
MNGKSARIGLLLVLVAVLATGVVSAQTVQLGSTSSITFKGFLSATFFGQDQNFSFGNGQNAEAPIPPETKVDRWFYGGDVRNTRLTMAFDGPKVGGDGRSTEPRNGLLRRKQRDGRFRRPAADPRDSARSSADQRQHHDPPGQQWAPLFSNTAVSLAHRVSARLRVGGRHRMAVPGIFLYQT